MIKPCWIALPVLVALTLAAFLQSQTEPKTAEAAPRRPTLSDFGLTYPLSNDWVRATEMLRGKMESEGSSQNFDLLLAAVYVPKSNLSATSPFFTLVAYRQPATDCRKSLEAMIANSQDSKTKPDGTVTNFSAAGHDYYRVNIANGVIGRHQAMICTAANDHLLVWNAGAPNEKGLDAIVATLDSITSAAPQSATESTQPAKPKDDAPQQGLQKVAQPTKVRASSGFMSGLLVKKVNPVYPVEARAAYIQGTVVLRAEISKTGDIADLELISGPIELAGSAVSAVRRWKYRPFQLNGEAVAVETQIQVNYELSR